MLVGGPKVVLPALSKGGSGRRPPQHRACTARLPRCRCRGMLYCTHEWTAWLLSSSNAWAMLSLPHRSIDRGQFDLQLRAEGQIRCSFQPGSTIRVALTLPRAMITLASKKQRGFAVIPAIARANRSLQFLASHWSALLASSEGMTTSSLAACDNDVSVAPTHLATAPAFRVFAKLCPPEKRCTEHKLSASTICLTASCSSAALSLLCRPC